MGLREVDVFRFHKICVLLFSLFEFFSRGSRGMQAVFSVTLVATVASFELNETKFKAVKDQI